LQRCTKDIKRRSTPLTTLEEAEAHPVALEAVKAEVKGVTVKAEAEEAEEAAATQRR